MMVPNKKILKLYAKMNILKEIFAEPNINFLLSKTETCINILHVVMSSNYCTLDILRLIVHKQPFLLNSVDNFKNTPLHRAIYNQASIEVIHELLRLGADSNARNHNLRTPLHCAVITFSDRYLYQVVHLLIKYKGDLNLRDRNNDTSVSLLLERINQNMAFETLFLLLKSGAVVSNYDSNYSILSFAIRKAHTFRLKLDVSKLLLEYGAQPRENIFEVGILPLKRDRDAVELVKLIMQYVAINKFRANPEEVTKLTDSCHYDKIVDLRTVTDKKCLKELISYRKALINELAMMRDDKIHWNKTLFSFLSIHCCSGSTYNESETILVRQVLSKLYFKSYRCCNDLLHASMKSEALKDIIAHLWIYVKKSYLNKPTETEVISLNYDTILDVASYLLKSDLINATLAFLDVREPEQISLAHTHHCLCVQRK